MKHVIKNQEPVEFTRWKTGKTTTKWERLNSEPAVKDKIHKSLMREQGRICCYCESKLTNKYSHIEHFVPRSLDSTLTFDYSNLLCSCQANVVQGTPHTCGNAKDNFFHKNLVSPLESDCEDYFTYTFDGKIKGKCARGYDTIDILNLNEPTLVERRENLITTFTEMLEDDSFTEEDISTYIQGHLSKNNDGTFDEFWTTISFLFGSMIVEDTQQTG